MAMRDKKPGFDSELIGNTLKIKLRGEIDHHSAVAVRSSIDDMIKRKRPAEVVIDMSAVDFMDSSGLGLIMGRYAVVKELGSAFCVLDPNPRIEKIMRLAGMERIVPIKHSEHKLGAIRKSSALATKPIQSEKSGKRGGGGRSRGTRAASPIGAIASNSVSNTVDTNSTKTTEQTREEV